MLILHSLDSNKPLPKASLLTALQLFASAWNEVSQATIVNCFKKAKISDKEQTIAINNENDPFKQINEDLQELREKDSSLMPESMTEEDLASADDAVRTRESTLTDEEILEETTKIDDDGVEDIGDEDDEELVAPSARDVEKFLEILKSLSLFSEQRGGQIQDLINKFETLFIREKVEKRKQVSITNYFVKKKIFFFHCHSYFLILSLYLTLNPSVLISLILPDLNRNLKNFKTLLSRTSPWWSASKIRYLEYSLSRTFCPVP